MGGERKEKGARGVARDILCVLQETKEPKHDFWKVSTLVFNVTSTDLVLWIRDVSTSVHYQQTTDFFSDNHIYMPSLRPNSQAKLMLWRNWEEKKHYRFFGNLLYIWKYNKLVTQRCKSTDVEFGVKLENWNIGKKKRLKNTNVYELLPKKNSLIFRDNQQHTAPLQRAEDSTHITNLEISQLDEMKIYI